MQGITNGFDIISPEAELQKVVVQNHKSALLPEVKKDMDNMIKKRARRGKLYRHASTAYYNKCTGSC